MSIHAATALAITNPLVKYRALVATKAIAPDNGQLRLALHLQKLYDRLKDYEPEVEYSRRLDQISRAVRSEDAASNNGAQQQSPPPSPRSTWRGFLSAKQKRDTLALTRRLTSHESALQLNTPKGLMLHGEVGTGKSMLIDLFAECLPNRKKRRWHFNTFMLETFSKLEAFRRDGAIRSVDGVEDYSLMWLAKDMIQTSPILFLDEFQMPDRVASKILTNLMTSFFHLGGVLVATSNRMPEELDKASGIEFQPPPSRLESLGWQFGFRRKPSGHAGRNEFAAFLEVLKARCEVWEMEGGRDYRRVESGSLPVMEVGDDVGDEWSLDGQDDLVALREVATGGTPKMPQFYHVVYESDEDHREVYETALRLATGEDQVDTIVFSPDTMRIYGRTIVVPRTYRGVADWTFDELCKTTLGPADYTTLASTYHTIILRQVPILTSLMKNEARRFITLLDALYECRCKLLLTASAGPDDLFFPDRKDASPDEGDAIQSETFSEAYQDATAPFRPNILTDNPNYAEPDPEPNYTHARFAGLLKADALEDDPPNKPHNPQRPFGRSFGRTDAEIERSPIDPDEERCTARRGPDFGKAGAFVGEDERFAYKRAQSRLWEMCGAKWWARSEEGWHRPLPADVRRWERPFGEVRSAEKMFESGPAVPAGDVQIGDAIVDETRDERSFRHVSASPFRSTTEPPPKISWTHAWGMMKWGRKAGAWGQGVDGLKDRGK
ncbi:AFG1-like ATPase-domain-containing protein [Neohortaea acidophila]|uniref:AFG1-like ATPase-domain-containing protein n=1 Tax=Neohortaea acidophila TaxID=245834 RepID=A0A6A6PLX9_9PEZI|nr:AFG1-like ATPase-domain-containing protein [Neohortaea acidophila]KAF2480267.1 AFG1-like ATPase-domain-containing protein [Neohortaea acidophila]